MAAQRDSINKAAIALCELIYEGGNILPAHVEAANRLMRFATVGGTYQKQYATHEERVLNRHLNLYINKRDNATTTSQRLHWESKIAEQEEKLKQHSRYVRTGKVSALLEPVPDLDLDGL